MSDNKQQQLEKIANDVLLLSRNTLLVNLRFLDMALSRLKLSPIEGIKLMTDGEYLAYDPRFVINRYRHEKEVPVRDYLHIVMHCIYRHMFIHSLVDQNYWSLACDIAVENAINELNLKSVQTTRAARQQPYIDKIKQDIKFMTAEKIYRYFQDNPPTDSERAIMRDIFSSDDHDIWYVPPELRISLSISAGNNSDDAGDYSDDNKNNSGDGQNQDSSASEDATGEAGQNQSSGDSGDEGGSDSALTSMMQSMQQQLEDDWKNVSERMQTDLETFSNGRGGVSQGLLQNLKEVNREKYDYTKFLKKFAVMNEAMKINDDEFDYIFYTYGLKKYKKMPLIEPLEYKDIKQINEFVVVIDTSGSVVGDLVQLFVQKTYNVLKSTESFATKINLHIIQCDDQIQEDVKITSQAEFDEYFKNMKLKGFGGNNEIAMFQYVDNLIKQGEFTNLKGMIYFTDGYGIFPKQKPDYDVAFAFVENERWPIPDDIPPWVIKLVLEKEDLEK